MTSPPRSEPPLANRLMLRGALFWWRIRRGMTLGVRAVVIDPQDRIFLVRHSYTAGWYIPGGGVEPGETVRQALARELAEEGNIELTGEPELHGVFLNARLSRRDHVTVHVVRAFRQTAPKQPDREIVEAGFFPADALPQGLTQGSAARIAEVIEDRPAAAFW